MILHLLIALVADLLQRHQQQVITYLLEENRVLKVQLGSGVEPIVLPPQSPNLHAPCERFMRSIKEEALAQMVLLGERSLAYAVQQSLVYYHTERNHQGLGNVRIAPAPAHDVERGRVTRRARLGGLLRYYDRNAA